MEMMEKLVNLSKRRGFVFSGSDIYGGLANTWDYGPLGSQLKKNIADLWWKTFVQERADMVGMDSGILMNPRVWEASGHVSSFHDAQVDCKNCKARIRADHLIEDNTDLSVEGKSMDEMDAIIKEHKLKCPFCGKSDFTKPREFNLLFKTHIGVVEESKDTVYLRGETAQGMFVNFKNVLNATRKKLPFGMAQIGKAFRNEITPGNFVFRTLEFEQMEIEYFFDPETIKWEELFEMWKKEMDNWMDLIGVPKDQYTWREHGKEELSHYSKRTADIEFSFPFGQKELYGLAYRTDFDLSSHQKESGEDLTFFDAQNNKRFVPHVIEPTFGLTRTFLAVLSSSYKEEEAPTAEEGQTDTRVVLQLPKNLSPVQVAILPLMKKDPMASTAHQLFDELKSSFACEYDETQSIGKRYRRQDEIGTPLCVTIDPETQEDNKVTIRERDTMKQERVSLTKVSSYIAEHLSK